MACVPQLLAAVIAAVAPPVGGGAGGDGCTAPAYERCAGSIYTSPLPACDRLGLSDEEGEVAARDLMHDGEPLTPAGGFDERDCKGLDRAPTTGLLDCEGAVVRAWANELFGTCHMPKVRLRGGGHVLPVRARPLHAPLAAFCAGASCSSDSLPLRSAARLGADPSWLLLEELAPPAPSPMVRLAPAIDLSPEEPPGRRMLRPPRA